VVGGEGPQHPRLKAPPPLLAPPKWFWASIPRCGAQALALFEWGNLIPRHFRKHNFLPAFLGTVALPGD